MKKYFMKESGNEIQFGDELELDFTKDLKNGHTKHQHLECKFYPELIPILLESGLVEEVEDEEEEENNEDFECPIDEVLEKLEALDTKMNNILKLMKELVEAQLSAGK